MATVYSFNENPTDGPHRKYADFETAFYVLNEEAQEARKQLLTLAGTINTLQTNV